MCARRIILYSTNRAEYGLVRPIREALGPPLDVDPFFTMFDGMENVSVKTGWGFAEWTINEFKRPDIALVPCDRQEMVGVALYLFYHNIPFAQLHAGDVGSGTHDEIGRWIISRCANLHFCNSPEAAQNLVKSGEESWRVHLVGSTAFDNSLLDDSILPGEPFDLLVIHPDTFSETQTQADIKAALAMTFPAHRLTVAIGPNRDTNWELVHKELTDWANTNYTMLPGPHQPMDWGPGGSGYPKKFLYYPNGLERPQFLGLMKHCERFITNSSSALYELPAFDICKYVPIGKRNADRKPLDKIEAGASKRIAEILATVEINDRLLRKKFV